MNEMDMMSPEKVAEMYGGDKTKIGRAAQMGLINPTVAVMAGMFIDRMRNAAVKEQQPQSTVAQDVMAPPMAAQAAPAMAAQAAPAQSGLDALPVPEDIVPDEYAGGGVVAFAGLGESLVQDIIEKETREIEQGLRPDYSIEAKQAMQQRSDKLAQENKNYFAGEQNKMLSQGKDIGAMYRPSGIAALAPAPVSVPAPISAPVPEGAPMTGADLRKADRAEMALRSAPGLTPAQSEERIAAARPEAAPKDLDAQVGLRRPSVAPAKYEDALEKAKAALSSLPKEDAFADIKAELSERKGKADEDLRQKAWMRVAEAGFGMMGGTSRYAAVNAGKAAVDAIKGYGEDLANQKKLDREDRKMLMDIKRLEKAEAREDVFKTTELAYKILNEANEDVRARLASETNLAIEASRAGTTRETNNLNKALTLANTAEQNIRTSLAKQAENPMSPTFKALKANPNYIEEQAQAARNRVLRDLGLSVPSMTTGAAPSGGRTVDFGSLPK